MIWKLDGADDPRAHQTPGHAAGVARPHLVRRRLAHAAPLDLYADDHKGMISAVARRAADRVYVPNSAGDSVDVIDPRTYKVVEHFSVSALPQHITPSHDLKTLYVSDDVGNTLTPIDPVTGRPGRAFPVEDPYNLYFTIDGRYAIVVAERLQPPGLSRCTHLPARACTQRPLCRCQPHGLLANRPLRDREL